MELFSQLGVCFAPSRLWQSILNSFAGQHVCCEWQDFVSAVMDVDYSPTGREFVAGSYDRTIRIFAFNGGHSREIYHTKRMQRVFSVRQQFVCRMFE